MTDRKSQLKAYIECLQNAQKMFPGSNVTIGTAIRSFESQLKELEKTV